MGNDTEWRENTSAALCVENATVRQLSFPRGLSGQWLGMPGCSRVPFEMRPPSVRTLLGSCFEDGAFQSRANVHIEEVLAHVEEVLGCRPVRLSLSLQAPFQIWLDEGMILRY